MLFISHGHALLFISLSLYTPATMPNTLFKQVNMKKNRLEYALRLLSYLSVLCRISFPFFHRLIAGGEAWGLHSRVTSLPERAFNKAFKGLLEKLGGEAVCWPGKTRSAEKGMRLKNKGDLNVCWSAALYSYWLLQLQQHSSSKSHNKFSRNGCIWLQKNQNSYTSHPTLQR